MNKAIEIEEMRISSNGEHLEFIINCPSDYQFTEFTIQIGTDEDEQYSIADSLFRDENGQYIETEDNRFTGQVPVSLFGVSEPSIYKIHLAADHIGNCELPEGYSEEDGYYVKDGYVYNLYGFIEMTGRAEKGYVYKDNLFWFNDQLLLGSMSKLLTVNNNGDVLKIEDSVKVKADCSKHLTECDCEETKGTIEADAWISDVSHAYGCLIDDILSLQAKCTDKQAQDRVIRNYLTLYAHQEALRLGYIDEAEKWFGLIETCFTGKCGKSKSRNVNAGCGCKPAPRMAARPRPDFYANCGCKK